VRSINPLATPEPWTLVSRGYADGTKPFFEQYCHEALRISGYDGSGKVLDVACGPGTLSLLIHKTAHNIQAIDFSQGMLDCFNQEILYHGIQNIRTCLMDGQNLTFADNEFNWAYSIFGLMFFPDRVKGFREIYRTLKPGGRAVVTSWAPVSDSTLMQMIFGTIGAGFSLAQENKSSSLLNLEDPDHFKHEMQQAGFAHVAVTHFDGSWVVTDIEEFLDWIVQGSAPVVILKHELDQQEWRAKRALMRDWLAKKLPVLPTTLHSRAYIGAGEKQ